MPAGFPQERIRTSWQKLVGEWVSGWFGCCEREFSVRTSGQRLMDFWDKRDREEQNTVGGGGDAKSRRER